MLNPAPKSSLTFKILVGMIAGVFLGLLLNTVLQTLGPDHWVQTGLVDGALKVGASIFMASLRLLVVPLVFVSLACGAAALDDIKKVGRIGGKTLGLYVLTTAFAVATAIAGALVVKPGEGFELQTQATFAAKEAPPLTQVLIDIFPSNPVRAMVEENMLQIIVFALLFGLAMTLAGAPGKRLTGIFTDLNEVIMKMVEMLMQLAPYGVFCLMARVLATQGLSAIPPMAKYFVVLMALLGVHLLITYPLLLKFMTGLSPVPFFKKFRTVMAFAFSTSSSNATLPVTLENVEHRLGVPNSIASFTIPLGATVNMDGTAIMQGVATVFIAQAYGIDIGWSGYLSVIVAATLASIGTAGVPGVGLVTLAMVLRQVNLPVEGIGLIIGVDRLLDMARTVVNVTGDAVVTVIVAHHEGSLDPHKYHSVDSSSI
jgi:Na+/H+-dicarboxylate symporter